MLLEFIATFLVIPYYNTGCLASYQLYSLAIKFNIEQTQFYKN